MFKRKNADEPKGPSKKEIENILKNCTIYKKGEGVPPNPFRVDSMPSQRLVDKYTRDNNINVTSFFFNPKDKSADVTYLANVDSTATRKIEYPEFLKHFEWKSFTVSEDAQTIYPKW